MARILARVLREEGYTAETAGDGRSGFARATDYSFDLLILDWMLPDRSGLPDRAGLEGGGRGHAGRLLDAMLKEIPDEGFAYSLLRVDQPVLYERHGWVPIGEEVVRTLLSVVAGRRGHKIQANLPPSLRGLLFSTEKELVEEFVLIGRVIDLEALAAALEPVWMRRIRTSDNRGDSFRLSTSAGTAEVQVNNSGIRVVRQETKGPTISVDERAFAHLLFRGFDAGAADQRVGTVRGPSLLRVLFPEQDFVVWRADVF
jgi:hypothetical protein